MKHIFVLNVALLSLNFTSVAFSGDQSERLLFEFSNDEAAAQWRPVNDGVMGGRSDGRFEITDEATMRFFGNLSLENNGGFASVRSTAAQLSLTAEDQIVIRVRGDGRAYLLNLYVPMNRIAFSYRAPIQTEKDQWIEVSIPVSDFEATSFGRPVRSAGPVDAVRVSAFGLILSDKSAGPFSLQVNWIKAVRGSTDN